jgi:hypothetical protein
MRTGPRPFVESWLRRRAQAASAAALAEEALAVVWARSQRSLSEVALHALARCALDSATRAHPLLADVRVGPRGFELGAAAAAPQEELFTALGGMLVEILTIVEETSGAILAPALQAELLRVGGGRRTPPGGVRPVAAG